MLAVKGLLVNNLPTLTRGDHRRMFLGLYSDFGRICDPIPIGRIKHLDDRQGSLGRIFLKSRLATGLCGCSYPSVNPDHSNHLVPTQ